MALLFIADFRQWKTASPYLNCLNQVLQDFEMNRMAVEGVVLWLCGCFKEEDGHPLWFAPSSFVFPEVMLRIHSPILLGTGWTSGPTKDGHPDQPCRMLRTLKF
ncbi:MAG: hypothetical protein OEW75_09515 [Cyclobacteriaceae bacterium]|nr:hypothetical protein [Cyclobacteriaceae bacterium]